MRLIAAATGVLLAGLAFATTPADASYSARIQGGTLMLTGNRASDKLALRLGDPQTLQADVGDDGSANYNFDLADFERILVKAGDGRDLVKIDESGGAFTNVKPTTLNGQGGDDTLLGGTGMEHLVGGPDDDVVDAGPQSDVVQLGLGADRFVWNPGDTSDLVEGGDGADMLAFNTANINERIDLSANGPRLRLSRDIANVTMDLDGLERINVAVLGGADNVAIHNLAGTAVKRVTVDLAALAGGGGDGQADAVTADGTPRRDGVKVSAKAGTVHVDGLPAAVRIVSPEVANDSLTINALGGADTIKAATAVADLIALIVNQ